MDEVRAIHELPLPFRSKIANLILGSARKIFLSEDFFVKET